MTNPGSREMLTLSQGQTLFKEGEKFTGIFVIMGGQIGVFRKNWRIARLGQRDVAGIESMYNRNGVYTYTAKAEKDQTRVVRYPESIISDSFQDMSRMGEVVLSSLAGQLSQCWVNFEHMHQERTIADHPPFNGDIRSYSAGEKIITEDEGTDEIFRILSTDKGLEVSKEGKKLAIITDPGEIFGEMASILKEARTATITSLGESMLEVYPAQHIMDILEDYPDVSLRMIQTLARRLAHTTKQLAKQTRE